MCTERLGLLARRKAGPPKRLAWPLDGGLTLMGRPPGPRPGAPDADPLRIRRSLATAVAVAPLGFVRNLHRHEIAAAVVRDAIERRHKPLRRDPRLLEGELATSIQ